MNKNPSHPKSKVATSNRLTLNSPIIKLIIDSIDEKGGEQITSLNLTGIEEAVADFFIICEADNPLKIKAIADNIERNLREELNERPFHFNLSETWTLVDYVDVVVHIFNKEERAFYDLEELWLDAEKQEHSPINNSKT